MVFIMPPYGFRAIEPNDLGLKILETIKLLKPFVLVWVTIAVMKHHDQSNLGRKWFI